MVPTTLVGGVGAVPEGVPPVAAVPYQFSVPLAEGVALNVAVAFWQTANELTPGALGVPLTVTGIAARGPSQPVSYTHLTLPTKSLV